MQPTSFITFLDFFFHLYPALVVTYRQFEKASIKVQCTKERILFLKECLQEKVIPRSLNWISKLDSENPFPVEAKKQLKLSILKAKEEIEYQFFKLRKVKRELRSSIHDPEVWSSIQSKVNVLSEHRKKEKHSKLQRMIERLIEVSPWTIYSNTENVVNLSSENLSLSQLQILGFGLNFSLPHEKKHLLDFVSQLEKVKIYNNLNVVTSTGKNNFAYDYVSMNLDCIFQNLKSDYFDFLPRRYGIAINELRQKTTLRICKADKGGKLIILDKSVYLDKMFSLLNDSNTYRKLKSNPLNSLQSSFNHGLNNIINRYRIKDTDTGTVFAKFLRSFKSRLSRLPYLYGLPKAHKQNIPMRPIISNINSPGYFLSKFLAKQLSPHLGSFSSAHLRHNRDLVNHLKQVIPMDNKFISFDVSALFTNVPLETTLAFLRRKLPTLDLVFDHELSVECIIDLIELCLKKSYFQFEGQFFEQIYGIAMGNPLSPVLAGFFLEHIETEFLPLYTGVQPVFWYRYVDDILCLVPCDFHLDGFLNFINSFYPSLKFTFEWEVKNQIPFLDVLIHKFNTGIKFSVYRKPTHAESYLHFFSCTSRHVKTGVAQSLFIRALRVCSPEYLTDEITHINKALNKLAYPKRVLNIALSKARKIHFRSSSLPIKITNNPVVGSQLPVLNNNNVVSPIKTKRVNRIILPFSESIERFIRPLKQNNWELVFTYKNKLFNKLNKNSPKCSDTPNGVYYIPCKGCPKGYLGETGRELKQRIKEHKNDIVRQVPESGVATHVREQGHKFNFDKAEFIVPCSDKKKRHIIESALIKKLGKRCVNLNNGFAPNNVVLSKYILDVINLRAFGT